MADWNNVNIKYKQFHTVHYKGTPQKKCNTMIFTYILLMNNMVVCGIMAYNFPVAVCI